jgi:hypothetical protein
MLIIPKDDEYLQARKGLMMQEAFVIAVKIAGVEGGDFHSIRIQNAAIIKNHAMHLFS